MRDRLQEAGSDSGTGTGRLPVGSGAWLSPDQAGEPGRAKVEGTGGVDAGR